MGMECARRGARATARPDHAGHRAARHRRSRGGAPAQGSRRHLAHPGHPPLGHAGERRRSGPRPRRRRRRLPGPPLQRGGAALDDPRAAADEEHGRAHRGVLQTLTAALSSATSPAQVADALLGRRGSAPRPPSGACWRPPAPTAPGSDIVDASPRWPAVLSGARARLSMTTPAPLSICAWIGSPLWIASRAAFQADYPHLAAPEPGAVACLPLSCRRARPRRGGVLVRGADALQRRQPLLPASPSRTECARRSTSSASTSAYERPRGASPRRSLEASSADAGSRPRSASASAPGRTCWPSSPTISATRSAPS